MFSNITNSIRDNFVQRTTNPFLGTLIIVWIIRNWRFVYSLIYFDSTCSLDCRIEKISSYFKDYSIWQLVATILISFLALVITYVLVNLSRLIINFFDKIVTPWTYKVTDKSSVVPKELLKKEEERYFELEVKYLEEKEKRYKAEREIEHLESKNAESESPPNKGEIDLDLGGKSKEQDGSEKMVIDNDPGKDFPTDDEKVIQTIYEKIRSDLPKKMDFNRINENILIAQPIELNDVVRKYLDAGLVEIVRKGQGFPTRYYLKWTNRGDQLRKKFADNEF